MHDIVVFGKKHRTGELLVQAGKLQQGQLERALSHQSTVPHRLGDILITLGYVSEEDLLEVLSGQLGFTIYRQQPEDEFLPVRISKLFHREHPFVLVKRDEDKYILVVSDPLDGDILSTAGIVVKESFEVQLTLESAIKKIVNEHYNLSLQNLTEEDLLVDESDIDKLKDMASEAPVIRYVNNLIDTAVSRRASDIHLEPFEKGLLIRFRIDGILHDYETPLPSMQPAIISRIKLLATLDIAERRLPQDGKIFLRTSGKEIDLRVSTMPTVHGEGVVIRILEKGNIILEMSRLGMPPNMEKSFKKVIAQPDGIVLVTGPTGSGKTTTLYCALNHINTGNNKIITIEDPVEYQLHGINQIQVRPEINLTFAKGLRSIVRQDPDVIMVGEIRDLETAEIAVQSSLTGHLVFSTLHTNDATSAVIRLVDIGIERFLLVSSLRAILAQRLVRTICRFCKQERGMASERGYFPLKEDFALFEGKGCNYCSQTGYSGRVGLFEFLVMNDAISRGVSQGLDLLDLKKIAEQEGFRTLFTDGLDKVREGVTTFSEVIRVSRGTENGTV
jgi:general secretion pathway protein E